VELETLYTRYLFAVLNATARPSIGATVAIIPVVSFKYHNYTLYKQHIQSMNTMAQHKTYNN